MKNFTVFQLFQKIWIIWNELYGFRMLKFEFIYLFLLMRKYIFNKIKYLKYRYDFIFQSKKCYKTYFVFVLYFLQQ